jgi:hypothetical protein
MIIKNFKTNNSGQAARFRPRVASVLRTCFLNNKGQAALMDSIFFLTIVSIVCTSLFFFAVNYGIRTDSQIDSFYSRDFSTDSLKVITYINVSRDGYSLEQIQDHGLSFENDYLLALIKEDYAKDKNISGRTQKAIVRTLTDVMAPFDTSIDYSFYLLSESETRFLFLLLATHECVSGDCNSPTSINKEIERNFFYCTPLKVDLLEKEIFPFVGKVDTVIGKITLPEVQADGKTVGKHYLMGLSTWITQDIDKLRKDNLENSNFNCEKIVLTIP